MSAFGDAGASLQPGVPGTAQLAAVAVSRYPITSRYYGIETTQTTLPDGTTVSYLRRRFLPRSDRFEVLHEHVVSRGDRIDNLSARYLGDASQYWRMCDANVVMEPEELERVGRRILVTLPEGIPGPSGV